MDKRRQASYLLEPPAGEVVRELLDEIDELVDMLGKYVEAEVRQKQKLVSFDNFNKARSLIAKHRGE